MHMVTTRCQSYIMAWHQRFLDVKSADIFLKQAKQWEVEGDKSGLLALQ